MEAVELQLLIIEHNACQHAWIWDPIAWKKTRAGEICGSCRKPLPQPHTPGCKRCEGCAGKHHVRMTFRRCGGWHCSFYTERWQPLPKRLIFRDAASIIEIARRGKGLIDEAIMEALDRSFKIGRGGLMLRLNDEQFKAIGGLPAATQNPPNNPDTEARGISPDS